MFTASGENASVAITALARGLLTGITGVANSSMIQSRDGVSEAVVTDRCLLTIVVAGGQRSVTLA